MKVLYILLVNPIVTLQFHCKTLTTIASNLRIRLVKFVKRVQMCNLIYPWEWFLRLQCIWRLKSWNHSVSTCLKSQKLSQQYIPVELDLHTKFYVLRSFGHQKDSNQIQNIISLYWVCHGKMNRFFETWSILWTVIKIGDTHFWISSLQKKVFQSDSVLLQFSLYLS